AQSPVTRVATDRATAPFMSASFRGRNIASQTSTAGSARKESATPECSDACGLRDVAAAAVGRDARSGRIAPTGGRGGRLALGAEARGAAVALEMAQVAQLVESGQHLDRDGLRAQRAVLVDARVDARRLALADRGAGDGVLGLAVPVKRAVAHLGQGDRVHDAVTVGGRPDEPEVDLAHHERGAVVLDHLLDRVADDPKELVLCVV